MYGLREGHYNRHSTIMGVFSTIASPVFSELVVVLAGDPATYLPRNVALFETLGRMNAVRPFNLVFLLNVSESFRGEARPKLKGALDSVTAKGLLDFLDSPPTIRCVRYRRYAWDETPYPDLN